MLNRGIRPSRQAIPAMPDVLAKMLTDPPSPKSQLEIRSLAMLLLGFGAALHHSELVGLGISDVARVVTRGLTVLVQCSKTNQHGRGPLVAICFNAAARPLPGAGLDPEKYFGHSMHARLAIATGDLGAVSADLMRRTRRKSTEVALGYLRPVDLWRKNATKRVFQDRS